MFFITNAVHGSWRSPGRIHLRARWRAPPAPVQSFRTSNNTQHFVDWLIDHHHDSCLHMFTDVDMRVQMFTYSWYSRSILNSTRWTYNNAHWNQMNYRLNSISEHTKHSDWFTRFNFIVASETKAGVSSTILLPESWGSNKTRLSGVTQFWRR